MILHKASLTQMSTNQQMWQDCRRRRGTLQTAMQRCVLPRDQEVTIPNSTPGKRAFLARVIQAADKEHELELAANAPAQERALRSPASLPLQHSVRSQASASGSVADLMARLEKPAAKKACRFVLACRLCRCCASPSQVYIDLNAELPKLSVATLPLSCLPEGWDVIAHALPC